MLERYFDIPFYKRLTSADSWQIQDRQGTHYHVARVFFRLNVHQLPGPVHIGAKIDGNWDRGITKKKVTEAEVFQQADTIERSIVESECMLGVLNGLTAQFGESGIFKSGGTVDVGSELSSKIKTSFAKAFKITNSSRKREQIEYVFTNTLPSDSADVVCGVEVYQRCRAELYLIQIDFLNVKYERTMFGLRKKVRKYPFPQNGNGRHPNIIKIGAPVVILEFWQLLPESSLIIKDADYKAEVKDETEITIEAPDSSLKDRPYWNVPRYPTLYQLSHVAFPFKWVNKKNDEYSKEELMNIELGEAEGSAWWFVHGPGRLRTKGGPRGSDAESLYTSTAANTLRYDVALSFANEDRRHAHEIAELLKDKGFKVFYDEYEKATLWGRNLYSHLSDVYQNRAQYCVIFISESYARKLWTKHELESAQARAFRESHEYILPLRLDSTTLPGIKDTVCYIDLNATTHQEVVLLLAEKLRQADQTDL